VRAPHLKFEKSIWSRKGSVCGVDEVGRGCLAGPVVAAAVSFDEFHRPHPRVRDSKALTPNSRQELFDFILNEATDFGFGLVSAKKIDNLGIVSATKEAMALAIKSLSKRPDEVLVDVVFLENIKVKQKAVINGDTCVYSIAAASIVAKVFRDRLVSGLDSVYPGYFFASHKGYGTRNHYRAISRHGLTPEHRKTFLKRISPVF